MIQPGHKLGTYELIEKVGQGGMAVVYRGYDSNLKREVAVKILHQHLSENREARERFGREAHAVAKLRHENILEIYDFSGIDSEESYIVTEFIDGCTLTEFMAEHQLHFPEIGAMITIQVCRALAHAHSLGVLHRDIKPENIMIRKDGIVKLTDFGIAQMVDLQRMTVTGQLLGSPAYMSPEHVEGRDLDFRTDVFAVGIMLYQSTVGALPFHGKNPHEILKRIADCVYLEAARVNPRIGKSLSNSIDIALSKDPNDRFADISLMQRALTRDLKDSGIDDPKSELARFFSAPATYQMALRERLISAWSERGAEQMSTDRPRAIECFNRVLSIDSDNVEVLTYLHSAERRQRRWQIVGIAAAVVFLVGLSAIAHSRWRKPTAIEKRAAFAGATTDARASDTANLSPPPGPVPAQTIRDATDIVSPNRDAGAVRNFDAAAVPEIPTTSEIPPSRDKPKPKAQKPAVRPISGRLPSDKPKPVPTRSYQLNLTPIGSEYQIGKGPWKRVHTLTTTIQLPVETQVIFARNPDCCQEMRKTIPAGITDGTLQMNLPYLPALLKVECNHPGEDGSINAKVTINGKRRRLGYSATIPITRLIGTEVVQVKFFSDTQIDEQSVTLSARESKTVQCQF